MNEHSDLSSEDLQAGISVIRQVALSVAENAMVFVGDDRKDALEMVERLGRVVGYLRALQQSQQRHEVPR